MNDEPNWLRIDLGHIIVLFVTISSAEFSNLSHSPVGMSKLLEIAYALLIGIIGTCAGYGSILLAKTDTAQEFIGFVLVSALFVLASFVVTTMARYLHLPLLSPVTESMGWIIPGCFLGFCYVSARLAIDRWKSK